MVRGDVYRFRLRRGLGHEQHGDRYGVVVQADEFLPRSAVLVAPTSRSARSASFRPEIDLAGTATACWSNSSARLTPTGSDSWPVT